MSDVAIQVENLGKMYRIGGPQARYKRFTESVMDTLAAPLRRLRNIGQPVPEAETLWALKDVSFEVKQGEVVGIIGRNGAGKSTLLKILSRITEPTEGEVRLHGRVGSLLEVGTGFHPELTGRENIYLNGTILGMKRAEIDRKFDEIVAFAEIEKFLDTPVKRYSSGMYVRLAFAVAAHLEPEILVVDEVLAVGDVAFQKKCLGKMGEVAQGGRTVLFVSHNMGAVGQLCSKGILLEHGMKRSIGSIDRVVSQYLAAGNNEQETVDLTDYEYRRGTQEVKVEWAQLRNREQEPCRKFSIGDDVIIAFGMRSTPQYVDKRVKVAVEFRSSDGIQLCNMVDIDSGFQIEHLRQKEYLSVQLTDVRFYPDTYYVSLWVGSITSTEVFDYVNDCLSFEIIDGGKLTTRTLPRSAGLLFLTPEWKQEKILT